MMKNLQGLIFILAATLFLQSCVANKSGNKRQSLASSVQTTDKTPTTPVFATDELLYWFSSQKVTGTITINSNSANVVYLRGQNVHNFLASKNSSGVEYYRKNYCVIGNYGAYKQLRLRAVPIFITNFSTKAIERILRIDIPSRTENDSACNFDAAGGAAIDGTLGVNAAYALGEICTNCGSNLLTSTSLKLFESASNVLTQIPTTQITLSSVALKVDLQSSSSTNEGQCTNSSCGAKGFDCCIEGQCVKDATMKPASTDPLYLSQRDQALADYAANPLSFLNYPNIYYICTNVSHNPPPVVTDPNTTPISEAQKRVAKYLTDYTCTINYESTGDYSSCGTPPSVANYTATKNKLAFACGCPSTYSQNDIDNKCPNWGVRPLYNSTTEIPANIVDFYCYTPAPQNPIGPITNLNVNVSSRSAPHRFFSTTDINKDDLAQATGLTQEGDDFFYLDEANKAGPVNNAYNVNSILGRMNVGLNQTQPGKMVAVELGKTYILSAISGYFTPCSKCAKDSWFESFFAHPRTIGGNGLRAAGYTTSRDTYSGNTTFGNYEDTKFGRACYVPVTMIPFSHKKESTAQAQRLHRLKTQAAYFVNGYQRDWYGFNKGALIGSFDGVTWFAVGSGRRVTATTNKLFLAINSSFLDLADRTDTVVNIIPDLSASNSASDYDYDPTLSITDMKQNQAATCQQYHQCSTDTDCVTQLGWEYACADMSQLRSRWPIYDTDGKELFNQEKSQTIFEILQGTATIGNSGKRCVYRGAGAPCVRDFTALNGNFNQKALTCAPNFYCAALTTNRFNNEVARSPNEFDNILFGMDANVLGRPLNYVTANKTLDSDIIANIKYNGASDAMGLTSAQADDMGICRPGKSQSTTASIAHSNPDTAKRTDYISQVGSCSSTALGTARTTSCPAIGEDLNYVPYDSTSPVPTLVSMMQNSCGGEAKHSSTQVSAFSQIEGATLQLLQNITQPKLAMDACFRRAGSVCHSDLDCSPNKMHGDSAGSMALAYFGGTQAEQSYWAESLVCGQGAAVPAIGTANYMNYKLNENRCCRAIGNDFTMYTSGSSQLVPENMTTNVTLDTKKFSYLDPTAPNRYSRYTVSETARTTASAVPNVAAGSSPAKNQWRVINETGSLTCCGGGWVRKFADGSHNWNVKNRLSLDTSNFSCLNYRSPLVNYDYNSFASDYVVRASYQREYEYFCKSPSQNGCMQILYRELNGYSILPPLLYSPGSALSGANADYIALPVTAGGYGPAYTPFPVPLTNTRLDTAPMGDLTSPNYSFKMNQDVPYQPFPYTFTQYPYDLYTFSDGSKASLAYFADKATDYGVSMYLPAYIAYNPVVNPADAVPNFPTIKAIYIKYFYANNTQEVYNITSLRNDTNCSAVITYPAGTPNQPITALSSADPEAWCVTSIPQTQNRPVLNIKAYTGAASGRQWHHASIIIDFKPIEQVNISTVTPSTPGNPYYYLTKLGRLELIGIPQITYEPIYCNSDQNKLLPGIFTSDLKTRNDFNGSTSTYNYSYDPLLSYDEEGTSESESAAGHPNIVNNVGNASNRFSYQNKLAHGAIFSAKDFACCTPLGKEAITAGKCCSGYAKAGTDGKSYCKLPTGTDLNVYFNKFVSSEGVGDDQPGGGLSLASVTDENTSDFHEYTGEPKLRASTFSKLQALGEAYCASGIPGNGGAFGQFPPEPYSGYSVISGADEVPFPISIVDSIIDSSDDNLAGKLPFDGGYRWDHHVYCK